MAFLSDFTNVINIFHNKLNNCINKLRLNHFMYNYIQTNKKIIFSSIGTLLN